MKIENEDWGTKYVNSTFWASNTMVTNLTFLPIRTEELLFSQIA